MSDVNEGLYHWRIRNYSELHTQEAQDKEERAGLAFTGNSPIGGEHAYGRLQTPKETSESRIELHFAKQGSDIRVEALNAENKTITFSASDEHAYHVAKEYLQKEGWEVNFDPKRVINCIESYFWTGSLDIRVESLNFETKIITISALSEDTFHYAQAYISSLGWQANFDPKRLPNPIVV